MGGQPSSRLFRCPSPGRQSSPSIALILSFATRPLALELCHARRTSSRFRARYVRDRRLRRDQRRELATRSWCMQIPNVVLSKELYRHGNCFVESCCIQICSVFDSVDVAVADPAKCHEEHSTRRRPGQSGGITRSSLFCLTAMQICSGCSYFINGCVVAIIRYMAFGPFDCRRIK